MSEVKATPRAGEPEVAPEFDNVVRYPGYDGPIKWAGRKPNRKTWPLGLMLVCVDGKRHTIIKDEAGKEVGAYL